MLCALEDGRHGADRYIEAERLRATDAWRGAGTLKANPDSPQWPVRQRAVEDGMLLYMPVPRLAESAPFLAIEADSLDARKATSIKGATAHGRAVSVEELEPVDLVVTGCVAVAEDGTRLGKGGGFSDLEFAIASEVGLIGPHTVVVTTVHELQVLPAGTIPRTGHDMRVDVIVTPDRIVEVSHTSQREPGRIRWDELTEDKIAAIPLLQDRRPGRGE